MLLEKRWTFESVTSEPGCLISIFLLQIVFINSPEFTFHHPITQFNEIATLWPRSFVCGMLQRVHCIALSIVQWADCMSVASLCKVFRNHVFAMKATLDIWRHIAIYGIFRISGHWFDCLGTRLQHISFSEAQVRWGNCGETPGAQISESLYVWRLMRGVERELVSWTVGGWCHCCQIRVFIGCLEFPVVAQMSTWQGTLLESIILSKTLFC